ncbi:MAG: hypothetical protein Q9164_004629 [Protoblastenia rupestris]
MMEPHTARTVQETMLARLASGLTCLELHFDGGPELVERMTELSGQARIVLLAAKKLQAIHVGFPSRTPLDLRLETMFHNIRWENLRAFGIQAWRLDALEIIRIVRRHKLTLRGLRLRDVQLKPGSKWKDVLSVLRSEMDQLDWVSLRRIDYSEHFDELWENIMEVADASNSDGEEEDDFSTQNISDQESIVGSEAEDSDDESTADTDHGPDADDINISPDTPLTLPFCTCSRSSDPASADDLGDNGVSVVYQQRKMWENGAGASKGHTSWTAKAEISDYISFAGLFIHYLHNICTHLTSNSDQEFPIRILHPITLILGGYSYGSMITTHLPSPSLILSPFSRPTSGTAAAEIRLRAQQLSNLWYKELQIQQHSPHTLRCRPAPSSHKLFPSTIAIGGEESATGSRRPSQEGSRKSIDATIRRSVDRSRRKLGLRHHRSSSSSDDTGQHDKQQEQALQTVEISGLRTAYLLVSPLLPPLSSVLTLTMGQSSARVGEDKLMQGLTLVVYGDKDIFTAQKKLRRWVERLEGRPRSSLRGKEVQGAGHFWKEKGVEDEMRAVVGGWVKDVVLGSEGC